MMNDAFHPRWFKKKKNIRTLSHDAKIKKKNILVFLFYYYCLTQVIYFLLKNKLNKTKWHKFNVSYMKANIIIIY